MGAAGKDEGVILCLTVGRMQGTRHIKMMTIKEMQSKGGKSRMSRLTPAQRKSLARKAAKARWAKSRKG